MSSPTDDNTTTVVQLAVLEIPPSEEHVGTVIFLHVRLCIAGFDLRHLIRIFQGLGQHAQQWEPIVRTLAAYLPGVKWVLPQRSVFTCNTSFFEAIIDSNIRIARSFPLP